MNFFVSYPKSGRTWLRVMFEELGVPMEFTHFDAGSDKRTWGRKFNELQKPKNLPGPMVFMHRDPRDTVASFFHEITKRTPLPLGRKIRFFAKGILPPKTIGRFVRSPRFGIEKTVTFNLACAHLPAHVVTYEDMRSDPVGHLAGMLDHIGHSAPIELVREVVENNTFHKMRQREAAGVYDTNKLRPTDSNDPDSFKVRRGKVGGWREEMDAETQEFANAVLHRYSYFDRMAELTKQ